MAWSGVRGAGADNANDPRPGSNLRFLELLS